jgi:SAM-dependent methyltransferase
VRVQTRKAFRNRRRDPRRGARPWGACRASLRDGGNESGLYLVSLLVAELELEPGFLVLDLGCGACRIIDLLSRRYGAIVVATDLWTDPTANARKVERRGLRGQILCLKLDAAQPLPFAEECTCSNSPVSGYQSNPLLVRRVSGPLLDRAEPRSRIGQYPRSASGGVREAVRRAAGRAIVDHPRVGGGGAAETAAAL